jgi:hypothetical protein
MLSAFKTTMATLVNWALIWVEVEGRPLLTSMQVARLPIHSETSSTEIPILVVLV